MGFQPYTYFIYGILIIITLSTSPGRVGSPPPWMQPPRTMFLSDACGVISLVTIRRDWTCLFAVIRSRKEQLLTLFRLQSYFCRWILHHLNYDV